MPRVLFHVKLQLLLTDQNRSLELRHQLKVHALFRSHRSFAVGRTASVHSIQEVADTGLVLSVGLNDAFLAAELDLIA
jgi:hypothetical protein